MAFLLSAPAINGPLVGGTTGSVLFVGSTAVIQQDNANLFFDDTNNRFRVATATNTESVNIGGNVLLVAGLPYYSMTPTGWGTLYIQGGVDTAGAGAGNYLLISVPASRGISFRVAGSGTVGMVLDPTGTLAMTPATLLDGTSAHKITATMPTTITAIMYATDKQITTAGSSAFAIGGLNVDFLAGYTGGSATTCGRFANAVAGTGTVGFGTDTSITANAGAFGLTTATTAGTNLGTNGVAYGGNISVGAQGISIRAKNSASNVGVAGFGLNTGTTPVQIGGYFGLQSAAPTITSAALMCDNGSTTSPIFVARDNGTANFTIADGGAVTHINSYNYAVLAGGGTAYTYTLTGIALTDGTTITFRCNLTATGASTLNVNALGAKKMIAAATNVQLNAPVAFVTDGLFIDLSYVAIYSTTADAAAGAWIVSI